MFSPLIANIYLDVLGHEMKPRGDRLVRYADDILILCWRKSAALHNREVVTTILEEENGITLRNCPGNLAKVIVDLNPIVRGFANYFRMANCKGLFTETTGWIRRRLRAKQLAQWKRATRLHRRLPQLGYRGDIPKMRMYRWRCTWSNLASWIVANRRFPDLGLGACLKLFEIN